MSLIICLWTNLCISTVFKLSQLWTQNTVAHFLSLDAPYQHTEWAWKWRKTRQKMRIQTKLNQKWRCNGGSTRRIMSCTGWHRSSRHRSMLRRCWWWATRPTARVHLLRPSWAFNSTMLAVAPRLAVLLLSTWSITRIVILPYAICWPSLTHLFSRKNPSKKFRLSCFNHKHPKR